MRSDPESRALGEEERKYVSIPLEKSADGDIFRLQKTLTTASDNKKDLPHVFVFHH